MKWLVIDDTAIYRKILQDVLNSFTEVDEVITVPNGEQALKKCETFKPDAITLDYEMPDMDGLQVMAALQKKGCNAEVVMVSAHTPQGAQVAIAALDAGAVEVLTKPESASMADNRKQLREQLVPVLAAVRAKRIIKDGVRAKMGVTTAVSQKFAGAANRHRRPEILAIGASTGGPKALTTLLEKLPAELPVPVVVTVHMPAAFTGQFAASLERKCALTVKEAEEGERLLKGVVYLAPGDRHLKLVGGPIPAVAYASLNNGPRENNCRPSVDVMFRSVAAVFGGASLGVILTGMGHDGVAGMKLMKLKGAVNIAQDEESCVVFGMPGKAVEEGVIDTVLPLEKIAQEVTNHLKRGGRL